MAVVGAVVESRDAPSFFALRDQHMGDMPSLTVFVDHRLPPFEFVEFGGCDDHDYTIIVEGLHGVATSANRGATDLASNGVCHGFGDRCGDGLWNW